MSKKLILAIAVLCFAFSGAAFAAVENIKVSGDINTEAVVRDFGFGNDTDNDDQFAFSQIRIRFDADLTEGVSAVISLINERIWGGDSASDGDDEAGHDSTGGTEVDLDLGYVELKEFLYQPLTLIVGRQNLRFGNALIIGDVDTNRNASESKVPIALRDLTLRKSFDAVRGILDFAPWTLDLIYAKAEENALNRNDDVTLFGVNAAYDWSSYNGITEAYFYGTRISPASTATNTFGSEDKVYVVGTRAQADLNDKLTLGAEAAYQFGDYTAATTSRHLSAYAGQLITEYRFLDNKNTKLGLNYTYLSGDAETSGSAYNGWNPMFEDQSPGEILNILFTNTNMQYWKASVSSMPREDITVGLDYVYARLVQDNGGATLTTSGGSAESAGTISLNTTEEKEIGHEIDLYGVYDYTEDVQLKISGGWLIPGNIFADANDSVAYSLRGGINVSF